MMKITKRQTVLGFMAALAAIAAYSPVAAEPAIHEVRIKQFKFMPETLQVKIGDQIHFFNDDIAPHTATADDKSWDTGKLNKGESATVEITEHSSGEYFCRFHPKMKAGFDITTD